MANAVEKNTPSSQTQGDVSISEATQSLAAEIAAEAQKEGWRAEDDEPEEESESSDEDGEDTTAEAEGDEEETEEGDDDEEEEEPTKKSRSTKLPAGVSKAIKAHDLEALADELGIEDPQKFFKIDAKDFKANRDERRKIREKETEATQRVTSLEGKLREKYGDPVAARKKWDAGDYDGYFEILEKWSGVPHADVQKAWHKHVAGKPAEDLVTKKKLRELEKKEEERKAQEETQKLSVAEQEKVDGALKWIRTGIKGDKLAKYPGIDKLVFDKLKNEFSNGVKTPKAALKLVREDLAELGKQLRSAGVLEKKGGGVTQSVTRSPAKRSTNTVVSNGKTRPMNDSELARDVLNSLGRNAWR